MPENQFTTPPLSSQELFRLKVNGTTILETGIFPDCLDQAWTLIHGHGMPASAIDILVQDEKTKLWFSLWDEETIENGPHYL